MKILKNVRLNQKMIGAVLRVCQQEEITFTKFIEDGIKLNLKEYKERIHVSKTENTWGNNIEDMPL